MSGAEVVVLCAVDADIVVLGETDVDSGVAKLGELVREVNVVVPEVVNVLIDIDQKVNDIVLWVVKVVFNVVPGDENVPTVEVFGDTLVNVEEKFETEGDVVIVDETVLFIVESDDEVRSIIDVVVLLDAVQFVDSGMAKVTFNVEKEDCVEPVVDEPVAVDESDVEKLAVEVDDIELGIVELKIVVLCVAKVTEDVLGTTVVDDVVPGIVELSVVVMAVTEVAVV